LGHHPEPAGDSAIRAENGKNISGKPAIQKEWRRKFSDDCPKPVIERTKLLVESRNLVIERTKVLMECANPVDEDANFFGECRSSVVECRNLDGECAKPVVESANSLVGRRMLTANARISRISEGAEMQ
jgi:hypothetical protein